MGGVVGPSVFFRILVHGESCVVDVGGRGGDAHEEFVVILVSTVEEEGREIGGRSDFVVVRNIHLPLLPKGW